MITKVISFPPRYFGKKKQLPLTSLMIVALKEACDKQHKGVRFGPNDIKGSVSALIERGLIVSKNKIINQASVAVWQVTPEAIALLKMNDIKVVC